MEASLFTVPLSVPLEYFPMVNDMVRMTAIQVVAQLLFAAANPNEPMGVVFLQTIVFVLIGVAVYWLIVRKVFTFMPTPSVVSASVDASAAGVDAALPPPPPPAVTAVSPPPAVTAVSPPPAATAVSPPPAVTAVSPPPSHAAPAPAAADGAPVAAVAQGAAPAVTVTAAAPTM